jgi:WD40 repeat protein
VGFSPDGKRLATVAVDQTIKLWDAATGYEVFTLRGHTGELGHPAQVAVAGPAESLVDALFQIGWLDLRDRVGTWGPSVNG